MSSRPKTILVLDQPVRVFYRGETSLYLKDQAIPRGAVLIVGSPIELEYDHRRKTVLPVNDEGIRNFILFEELSPEKQQEVVAMFRSHPLLASLVVH